MMRLAASAGPLNTHCMHSALKASLLALVAMLAITVMTGAAQAASTRDELAQSDPLVLKASDALWWGDFDALQQLYTAAKGNSQYSPAGQRPVDAVRQGIDRILDGSSDLPDAYFSEMQALTAQWVAQHPQSTLAHYLYAQALLQRAWHWRGDGYWQTVPPEGRRNFQRYSQLAADHIEAHHELMVQDTSTHVLLMNIGLALGWNLERRWAVAEDGMRREPGETEAIYISLLHAMTPQWGGSERQMAALIDHADEHDRADGQHVLYAVLYSSAASTLKQPLFEAIPQAQWTKIKQGFEALKTRWTDLARANRFAYLACLANDRESLKAQLRVVGEDVRYGWWKGGGTGGRQNYEACRGKVNA
jgi:hypothetical protein